MLNHTMTLLLTALVSLLLVGGCQAVPVQAPSTTIQWRTLAQGKAEAKARRLPSLVDFYIGSPCPRCKALDQEVYSDAKIAERINREFVPVRVDLNRELSSDEQRLMEEMKTGGECILLFLDPDGAVVANQQGTKICSMSLLNQEQFLDYLDQAQSRMR